MEFLHRDGEMPYIKKISRYCTKFLQIPQKLVLQCKIFVNSYVLDDMPTNESATPLACQLKLSRQVADNGPFIHKYRDTTCIERARTPVSDEELTDGAQFIHQLCTPWCLAFGVVWSDSAREALSLKVGDRFPTWNIQKQLYMLCHIQNFICEYKKKNHRKLIHEKFYHFIIPDIWQSAIVTCIINAAFLV